MLNLKKINLNQKHTQIETEEQSIFTQQSHLTQTINQLITKQKPYPHNKIIKILNLLSSISGQDFAKLLSATIAESSLNNDSDLQNSLKILQQLIAIPHSQQQVKSSLKKEKHIDAILLLSLLWEVRQNQTVWKYVSYMIQCYPAEMILNGKDAIQRWNEYFSECEQKLKVNEQVKRKVAELQLKQRIRKQVVENKKEKGFTDSYINL